MEDCLYLDDNINFYSHKKKEIMLIKPYKGTLRYGKIIDRDKFISKMNSILTINGLNSNIFNKKIKVIINSMYSKEDKQIIIDTLEELNYKDILLKQELDYLKLNKDKLYINYNKSYFYIFYTNIKGNSEIINYDNNKINKELVGDIIKKTGKNKIYIYGDNYEELISILEKNHFDYYYFEDSDNLVLKKIINIMSNA